MRAVRGRAWRSVCLAALVAVAAGCLPATALALTEQKIIFTSTPPNPAVVGGPTYTVEATGGGSGNPVTFTVDPASSSVCTISGPMVSFIGDGTCTIDANQEGNTEFDPAPQAPQSFPVTRNPQTVQFTSTPPASATAGGSYVVTASATSGLPPALSSATPGVCTLSGASSGSTVTFVGPGTCTLLANQAGDTEYEAAPQAVQSFGVSPALTITPSPAPKPPASPPPIPPPSPAPKARIATFKAVSATLHSPSFTITLKEQVSDPGTLSWVLTFPNRTFGVFAAANGKCKAGFMRLGGKCRPKKVTYGRGSVSFAAAGTVTITVKPSAAAKKALRTAMRKKKNMRITAVLTFKPSTGAAPVIHTQVLTVKLAGAK